MNSSDLTRLAFQDCRAGSRRYSRIPTLRRRPSARIVGPLIPAGASHRALTAHPPGFVRTVLNESEFFDTRPQNIVCLRNLAEVGWPYANDDDARMSHDQWVLRFAEKAFETRHAVQCKQTGFHVHALSKETLERECTPAPAF